MTSEYIILSSEKTSFSFQMFQIFSLVTPNLDTSFQHWIGTFQFDKQMQPQPTTKSKVLTWSSAYPWIVQDLPIQVQQVAVFHQRPDAPSNCLNVLIS